MVINANSDQKFTSSMLIHHPDYGSCAVCKYLAGSVDVDVLNQVISLLDAKLARAERSNESLTLALVKLCQ